jgi:hypothetical protein
MKRIKRIILVLAILGFAVPSSVFAGTVGFDTIVPQRFSPNFILDGVELSGYTYPVAYMKFNLEYQKMLQDLEVLVSINGKSYSISAEDIDFSANTLDQLQQIWIAQTEGYAVDTAYSSSYSYDHTRLDELVGQMYNEACAPPESDGSPGIGDPVFDFSTRKFTKEGFVPSVIGYSLTKDDFSAEVVKSINEAIFISEDHRATLNANANPIYSVPADISNYGLLGTYTTRTTNIANRNTNIRLASEALTNATIPPGKVYSFNSTLGGTSKAKGYKEAGILVNGKPSTGIGGGICQVSSTMYNAVQAAGLKIVERHAHSAAVGYVPKGKDATVSYGSLDFKWQNNTSSNIYMVLNYADRTMTVSVYGKK